MNLLKNICDYEINYKFHLSLLEADKKTFLSKHSVLWNVRLRYESGFNLIFFSRLAFTFLGTRLCIRNKICAFHELIEVEDC